MHTSHVGERVEWDVYPTTRVGVVVELPKHVDYDVDALTGRRPGESVVQFGLLAGVLCTDQSCQCNTSAWTHSVNESQLRAVMGEFVEVALW
jgi:hypothetical protein